MGLFAMFQLASLFVSAEDTSPQAIVFGALEEVIDLMPSMCANEGQTSVIENTIIPLFVEQTGASASDDYEWEDVDGGEYMDFVGEIVAEGNMIMEDAFAQAKEMQEELAEYAEEGDIEFEE